MRGESATDWEIAAVAECQHGVITRSQLRDIGLSDDAIDRRIAAGRIHAVHRGVYAVGHRVLTHGGRLRAALFACGPGAMLSHRSAAEVWGLLSGASAVIDVTVPTGGGRKQRRGIRIHRARVPQRTTRSGMEITSVARTLVDVALGESVHVLERAVESAEKQRLDVSDLPELVMVPGFARVVRALDVGWAPTRSRFEERFLRMCRTQRLPAPAVNATVLGLEVDFMWAEHRVVAEADSWEHHRTRQAFERDRARDELLSANGYHPLRFTWRRLRDDPRGLAGSIRSVLALRVAS